MKGVPLNMSEKSRFERARQIERSVITVGAAILLFSGIASVHELREHSKDITTASEALDVQVANIQVGLPLSEKYDKIEESATRSAGHHKDLYDNFMLGMFGGLIIAIGGLGAEEISEVHFHGRHRFDRLPS